MATTLVWLTKTNNSQLFCSTSQLYTSHVSIIYCRGYEVDDLRCQFGRPKPVRMRHLRMFSFVGYQRKKKRISGLTSIKVASLIVVFNPELDQEWAIPAIICYINLGNVLVLVNYWFRQLRFLE